MKRTLLLFTLAALGSRAGAQTVDSIYANLYTDSLKKGTYNYINIDGKLTNGHWLPLDSTTIIFTASAGRFLGNSLWIDQNFTDPKVRIRAVLRSKPSIYREFDVWVKTLPDPKLRSVDEILNGSKKKNKN